MRWIAGPKHHRFCCALRVLCGHCVFLSYFLRCRNWNIKQMKLQTENNWCVNILPSHLVVHMNLFLLTAFDGFDFPITFIEGILWKAPSRFASILCIYVWWRYVCVLRKRMYVFVCVSIWIYGTWNNGQAFNQLDGQNAEWNELLVLARFFYSTNARYTYKHIIHYLEMNFISWNYQLFFVRTTTRKRLLTSSF